VTNVQENSATTESFDDSAVRDGRLGIRRFAHILGCGRRQVNEGEHLRASFGTT
jgi:hypothetical protein